MCGCLASGCEDGIDLELELELLWGGKGHGEGGNGRQMGQL